MRSPGVQGLGLDVGAKRAASGGGGGGGTSNLLLWTEAIDNAVWQKNLVTVTPDFAANPNPPGDGSSTADACAFGGANRFMAQAIATTTAGASNSQAINPVPATWTRISVSTTFDVGTYTASVYVQLVSGLGSLKLVLDGNGAGGTIRAQLITQTAAVVALVWGWQLETGGTATGYVPRTT